MRLQLRFLLPVAMVASALLSPLTVRAEIPATSHAGPRPTAESALAAEEELAKAMRDNDADGIARMLADDWAVINAFGGVAEGKDVFPSGIRAGILLRKTYEISEPRVRLFGNTAVVTVRVALSGVFSGKPFDVVERVTDVFQWKDRRWKAIVTHETFIPAKAAG